MSPRTDSYLSLCLEQASKSSLHYRHGCIIISGGKIIGNGYNDYRPGYNGGALKTGKLAACSALNSPAILALKQKQKQKQRPKSKPRQESTFVEDADEEGPESASTSTLSPFESPAWDRSGGGRRLANQPLSMHSEMMAPPALRGGWLNGASNYPLVVNDSYIYEASKRTLRPFTVSRPALYTRHVASDAVAGLRFKSRALKGLHLNAVKDKECNETNGSKGNKVEINLEREKEEKKVRAPSLKSAEKVCVQTHYRHQYEEGHQCLVHHHTEELQQHGQQYTSSRSKAQGAIISKSCSIASKKAQPALKDDPKHTTKRIPLKTLLDDNAAPRLTRGHSKNFPTRPLPRAHTGAKAHTVVDRMKDPRLRGADLYVARLGWKKTNRPIVSPIEPDNPDDSEAAENRAAQGTGTIPKPEPVPSTRSLHDELRLPAHSPPSDVRTPAAERPCVSASRPCYRCICYMHTVGIKRVFWTNGKGDWEGCKVRNMMDALDLSGSTSGEGTETESTGGPAGNGVFVTKHEVLMLKQLMAAQSGTDGSSLGH
ncbi:hypothetical protein MMC27_007851 [Xylographa pallens]|nr:hypothetical protein [Xylographa pallens]